jgi:CubicO group peptidase (beta-lactamase class C family)
VTTVDELLTRAQRDVDRGWLPACQLAVARDGRVEVLATFGDATDETRFCVFSATKPLVASAIWLLLADGSLDTGRFVADYVPEFATNGKDVVTVEQVLLHTSGFPNAPMLAEEGADPARRRARFEDWRLEWEPGTRFEYHGTSAHWVLADLIERLAGSDFRDFIEQRVCRPLGLPRVLGLPPSDQRDIAPLVTVGEGAPDAITTALSQPATRAAGVPGGGAIMTAAHLARFYQALLHNDAGLWDDDVLADARTNIRCTYDDPLMGVPVNRTLGLVVAGDHGKHILRYAIFGEGNSPGSFGHAGAHGQVAWCDPATGISFVYLTNGCDADVMREGIRGNRLATIAAELEL